MWTFPYRRLCSAEKYGPSRGTLSDGLYMYLHLAEWYYIVYCGVLYKHDHYSCTADRINLEACLYWFAHNDWLSNGLCEEWKLEQLALYTWVMYFFTCLSVNSIIQCFLGSNMQVRPTPYGVHQSFFVSFVLRHSKKYFKSGQYNIFQ